MWTKNKKGFTLAELLIVVAIIAVLVAISIPIFSSQLEKSREATDLANVRGAYAQVMAAANTEDQASVKYGNGVYYLIVDLKQKQDGWTTSGSSLNIGGVTPADKSHWIGSPKAGSQCRVSYRVSDGVKLTWSGDVEIKNLAEPGQLIKDNDGKTFTAESIKITKDKAFFTRNITLNEKTYRTRSFYVGEGSVFQKDAENFDKNPVPTTFKDSSFYKDSYHDKYTNEVAAFAYFDLDENNNVKNYTFVTPDAVYYSADGGKTWTQK
ncbi:type IV pilin protein [Bilifractor sp. LCP19S3_H10]|uniref:type IV pilin protein n=1 Tax=Bilifractor sp. LCP19S3_H10 TaxID=3438736 RepID=UPI003F91150C